MHVNTRQNHKFIPKDRVKSEKKFSIRDANCESFSLNSSSLSREKQEHKIDLKTYINKYSSELDRENR